MAKQSNKGGAAATNPTPAAAAPAQASAPATAPTAAPVAVATLPTVPAALVPTAPPKGASQRTAKGAFVNPMPRSTVANPVQTAWQLYAALYQQHGPALTRTQACNAAMAAGVAYYTARTQYQLWRTALLASAATAAQQASA